MTPPEDTHYYNFAWGDHGGKKTNNTAEATRQQNKAARDEPAERYSLNRDRAFDKANFIRAETRRQQELELNLFYWETE